MEAGTDSFQFAQFRLDCRRRQLFGPNGEPLSLTAKAFDTLVYLLQHSGQVVDRSELLKAVWPDTIVEENNLSQAIAALRRVLGHDIIVTVPRRGYQLTAQVQATANARDAAATDDLAAASRTAGATAPSRAQASWLYAACATITVATLGSAYAYLHLTTPSSAAVDAAADDRREADAHTLAVLPFVNLSASAEQEYFADGLTEELINRLAGLGPLRVTARTSAFAFKGSNRNVEEIARTLGVRHVLEGSVARAGNRVRVRVQLVDATHGYGLWSQSFDRDLGDAFTVEEEIAQRVAAVLLGAIDPGSATVLGGTTNGEAYDLYLAARASKRSIGDDDILRRLEQIDRALALDETFALAWAEKSRLENRREVQRGPPMGEGQSAAERAARRALDLEPRLGFAHTALGATLMTRWERVEAEAAFRRGQALGNREDLEVYGLFLLSVGHYSRARDVLSEVRLRDPLNPEASAWLATAFDGLGETDAALAEYARGRQLFGRWSAGLGMETLTRLSIGSAAARQLPELYPQFAEVWRALGPMLKSLDEPEKAMIELRALYEQPSGLQPYLLAGAVMLGEPEFAVEGLMAQAERRSGAGSATGIYWSQVFDDVRRLPRFKDLVRDAGLIGYWREYGWPDRCRPTGAEDFECF